jgi:RecA/RadA recombinase
MSTYLDALPPEPDEHHGQPERLVRIDTGPAWRGERERPVAAVLRRSDGLALFPVGVGYIFGDSGDGKSWLMLIAALQLMRAGRAVVWVTYEDPNEDEIVERLKLLGATEDDLAHLHLFAPDAGFGMLTFELARYLRTVDAALAVLDSVGEANAVEGVNEDKDAEWGPWARFALRRLYDLAISDDWDDAEGTAPCSGLVVAPIDHSTKSKDNPHFPSGTKRKRAMVTGLMVSVNVREPIGREHVGRVQLICSKDRTGRFRRGEIVAEIVLDATTDPYDVTVYPPKAGQEMAAAKKRNATERVLEVLNNTDQALTASEVQRIANSQTNKLPGEADLADRTVTNALSKLTGVTRQKEPTGVGAGYVIRYRSESRVA